MYGRVDEDLGALALSVERLEKVSGRSVRGAGSAPTELVERPPILLWGYRGDGEAEGAAAAAE